jgi:calcineurin-like phosphoesterase family protein/2'-5' RNA ligase
MSEFLIEFRFSGYTKEAIKELKDSISKNFHVTRRKIVPHISLVGPLYTRDEKRLVKEVKEVCKQYELVKFKLDGFDNFENRVIYVRIKPSEELKNLRLELVERLAEFCKLSEFDTELHFTFHATLVMNDIQRKFDRIWEYLQSWEIPKMQQYVVRITILSERRRILAEYDLLQRKILNRRDALDRKKFKKTLKNLDKKREPSEIEFKNLTNKGDVYVFSDTHFDHANMIKKFVFRPFYSKKHMNHELITNWNNTVKDNDAIYFLGDLSVGRNRYPIDYWLSKLNGAIFFIRGNHDDDIITRATIIPNSYGVHYGNYKFLLRHDPHRPYGYEGWIIHGDKHNNDLKNYPFINQKNKTVNVCAELIDYTPLNFDTLISLIETGRSYKTILG